MVRDRDRKRIEALEQAVAVQDGDGIVFHIDFIDQDGAVHNTLTITGGQKYWEKEGSSKDEYYHQQRVQ